MPGPPVLLDTSGLLALLNRDDALHTTAVAVRDRLAAAESRFVVSDWILTELLASCARNPLRPLAVRTVQTLRSSPASEVMAASRESWDAAFELYHARADKDWSLVDCASILVCRERGIEKVFSHDRHFTQAGLETLLR